MLYSEALDDYNNNRLSENKITELISTYEKMIPNYFKCGYDNGDSPTFVFECLEEKLNRILNKVSRVKAELELGDRENETDI